jgi:hypothetical protein
MEQSNSKKVKSTFKKLQTKSGRPQWAPVPTTHTFEVKAGNQCRQPLPLQDISPLQPERFSVQTERFSVQPEGRSLAPRK